jgi:hypothetical protein
MLPGFSAISSLYRTRHPYACYNASLAVGAIQPPPAFAVIPTAYRAGRQPITPIPFWPWPHLFVCPPALTDCGGRIGNHWLSFPKECVDIQNDPDNCGECYHQCSSIGPGLSCQEGVCGSNCCSDCCVSTGQECPCYEPVPEGCCTGNPTATSFCCPEGYVPNPSSKYPCTCVTNHQTNYALNIPISCCTSS